MEKKINYYGSLCTEMYEILHPKVPQDELDFYLSYAKHSEKILEPLCGSGRFLIPFAERGFDICGIDQSKEMLAKLIQKSPACRIIQADIADYCPKAQYGYIFISSGSLSLFTNMDRRNTILEKIRGMLAPGGKFVFAVDTVANRSTDADGSNTRVSVKTGEGLDLVLKSRALYEKESRTQFFLSIYELYNKGKLIQRESMDFQLHLYRFGEMEEILFKIGFKTVSTYSSFKKETAQGDEDRLFLYECSI